MIVSGWMRMVGGGTPYSVPTSEAAYMQHGSLLDEVIVPSGGKLQANGTWAPQPDKTGTAFAQALPGMAQAAGQRYIISATAKSVEELITFLSDEGLWEDAADDLVETAQTRFDAPWDAVLYDILWLTSKIDEHEAFIQLLSYKVRQAGFPFAVAYRAIEYDHPSSPDLDIIAQSADEVHCYAYWSRFNYSTGPYWWTRDSVKYALDQGIPARRLRLGVALYSQYWPVTGGGTVYALTYDQALGVTHASNSFVQWIEDDEHGLVRERYADVGAGHIWIQDGATLRHRLDLVDEFGLSGVMLFTPGMGADSVWPVIARSKKRRGKPATPVRQCGMKNHDQRGNG